VKKMKATRAGTKRKIEQALANHTAIMARFQARGMSKEDASIAASKVRIEMDGIWRSQSRRRAFETATGECDPSSESYQARFLEWAAEKTIALTTPLSDK
jgi:hypothetical protein